MKTNQLVQIFQVEGSKKFCRLRAKTEEMNALCFAATWIANTPNVQSGERKNGSNSTQVARRQRVGAMLMEKSLTCLFKCVQA